MYFGLMKKYKEQYGMKIFAYSLMPNHIHLLLEVDEKNTISTVMHNINSSYTKYFNGRYERRGHLFRERFKAALVEKDPKVLLNLTAYMHLNAENLEIAAEAKTYPHSSYSLYLNYQSQSDHGLEIKSEIEEILVGLIGEGYEEFMQKAQKNMDGKKMHKQLQRKGMLGSQEFIEEVKKKIEQVKDQPEVKTEKQQQTPIAKKTNKPGTLVLIIVLAATGFYLYFNFVKQTAPINNKQIVVEQGLENLDLTQWQIKLTSVNGKEIKSDVLSFNKGKVASIYLLKSGYPMTNYSMSKDGDKIIWETMQTSPEGTATWRGEVVGEKMNGIMSLRQKGKSPQDFSFKSIKFKKKIGGTK